MFTKISKILLSLAMICAFALSSSVALAGWTAPKSAPPACNPDTDGPGCYVPLNVGSSNQTKAGGLVLGGGLGIGDRFMMKAGKVFELAFGLTGKETNAGKIYYSVWNTGSALEIYGAGTAIGKRLVRIWDNLNVQGDIYARNYYICTASGSCSPFTGGGSDFWQKSTNGVGIYYTSTIGVAGASAPNSTLSLAIGNNTTGIKGGTGLDFVTNGTNRLSIDSVGSVSVPADKYLKLGTANLKASASSLDITGVGASPNRKVTIYDDLYIADQICTISGICKTATEIINNIGGGTNYWRADTVPGYIATDNMARAKGLDVSTSRLRENNSVIADNVRAANTVYAHQICLVGGTDFTGGTGGTQCRTSFSSTATYPNIVQCIFTPNPDTVSGGSCTWSGIDEADATTMSCPTDHAYKVVSGGVECGKGDRVEASTATGNTSWKVNCEDKLVKASLTCVQVGS